MEELLKELRSAELILRFTKNNVEKRYFEIKRKEILKEIAYLKLKGAKCYAEES